MLFRSRGMAEIIIAKNRNGALGDVVLRFKGEFMQFSNPEDESTPDEHGIMESRINTKNNSSNEPLPF